MEDSRVLISSLLPNTVAGKGTIQTEISCGHSPFGLFLDTVPASQSDAKTPFQF